MAPGPGEGGETVPQPADVSKVATGDPAKMAALPQRSRERELEGYSGNTNRETVSRRRQKNKVDVQPRSIPSLRGAPVWVTGRELSGRTNRDSSRPSFPARASHRRVRRKMCHKTGERPPSHLVLSYRQLSFGGGNGDGEDMGTALPMPEELGKVRSHQDGDGVDEAESVGETEEGEWRATIVSANQGWNEMCGGRGGGG